MALLYSQSQQIGWKAPYFSLKDTSGKEYTLKDSTDKDGLLVCFTCNHCPYAQASWPILIQLYREFKNKVHFIGINSNDAQAYPEDSFEEMKMKQEEWGIPFPYLHDNTQEVARAYHARCTPDIYLFKNEKLFYHGRINDNWRHADKATQENLKDALIVLIHNQEPPAYQPPSMGCSIKWVA